MRAAPSLRRVVASPPRVRPSRERVSSQRLRAREDSIRAVPSPRRVEPSPRRVVASPPRVAPSQERVSSQRLRAREDSIRVVPSLRRVVPSLRRGALRVESGPEMQSMRGASIACALTMALVADAEASRGYLGIDVVVRPEGLMVWRVLPGPLDGTLLDCASVARGDLIVSIDGEAASIESWNAISARESGSKVRIGYRVGEPRGWRGEPNLAGEARELSVTLDDESIWRGWCHSGELPPLRALELKADVDCAALVRALDSMGPAARARGEKLIASLDTIAPTHGDPATPPLLRAMMAEPAKSEALVRAAICDASDFRTTPWRGGAKLVLGLSGNSGAPLPEPHGAFKIERAEDGVNYLDFLLNGARALFEQSVARDPAPPSGLRSLVVERLDELLVRGPHSRESMVALQAIPLMNPAKAAAILAHFDVTDEFSPSLLSGEPSSVPDTIKTAVEGSILAAREIPQIGWVVVGAAGPNRYDLGRIAAVLDLGGDDTYAWKQAPGQHRLVIDLAGNDVHTGGEIGPGGSLGAISVIDDRAGNDRYEGGALTAGTALGVAAIVDRAGDDVYSAGPWSLGAAAGGVGAYIDFEGRDQRQSGEFSQGCGYYLGLGIAFDAAGDDVSVADRYGLGSAAHQSAGIAIDLGGNDIYVGRTAAHLGAAWDESLGYFVDAAGDDSYRADGLSIGAAAQQALAIAIDRGGADQYRAASVTIGAVADNEYHFDAKGLGSFAVFFDLAGFDLYPMGRTNESRIASPEGPRARLINHDSFFLDEHSGPSR